MKVVFVFLAAILVGITGERYDSGVKLDVLKAQLASNCKLVTSGCRGGVFSKEICRKFFDPCVKKLAKERKSKEVKRGEKKPDRKPFNRHHHKRPRMCPKKFCRCFGGLIKCIHRVHNKTMDYKDDDYYENEYTDQYYEEEMSPRNMSGPPMVSEIAAMFWEKAKNESGRNGTMRCFMEFKTCLKNRTEAEKDKNWDDEEDEDDEDEDDEDEEYGTVESENKWPMGKGSPWKWGDKFRQHMREKSKGIFSRVRDFMKKVATKIGYKRGYKYPQGPHDRRPNSRHHHGRHHHGRHHHGRHHHGRHHHGRHIPRPFLRCMFLHRRCGRRASTKKAKIECFKRVARCILGACRRLRD